MQMKSLSTHINEAFEDSITICIVGDIMQHKKQLFIAASTGYTYKNTFTQPSDALKYADFAIGNLETTIGDDKNAGFPNFSAPVELLDALKVAGFDALITANNHTCDNDDRTIQQTHTRIIERGMKPLGTCGDNSFTFSTSGIDVTFHIATDIMNDDNWSELVSRYDVNEFEPLVGHNIAIIHCGKEYSSKATRRQLLIRADLIALGFDAIIFMHSHVIGANEIVRGSYVCYGMGNFLSDQENLDRQIGQILQLRFTQKDLRSVHAIGTETIWTPEGDNVIIVTDKRTLLE